MPQDDAERGTFMISALGGGGKIVLPKLTVLLHVGSPEVKMRTPLYDVLTRSCNGNELVRIATVRFVGRFPYSSLKGAEAEVVVYLCEMVVKLVAVLMVKSITHKKAEPCLPTSCRLVPFQYPSLVLTGSSP